MTATLNRYGPILSALLYAWAMINTLLLLLYSRSDLALEEASAGGSYYQPPVMGVPDFPTNFAGSVEGGTNKHYTEALIALNVLFVLSYLAGSWLLYRKQFYEQTPPQSQDIVKYTVIGVAAIDFVFSMIMFGLVGLRMPGVLLTSALVSFVLMLFLFPLLATLHYFPHPNDVGNIDVGVPRGVTRDVPGGVANV